MKKFCVFTQTYGNERKELFDYHYRDTCDIFFRNQFDLNYYSFHNCDPDYAAEIQRDPYFMRLKNLEFHHFNNIEFTHIFRDHLFKDLLKRGFTHFIYLQDDTMFVEQGMDLRELIHFIKNEEYNCLYLEYSNKNLGIGEDRIRYERNGFKVYNTNTQDFFNHNQWAWDDGAYVGEIKWILKNIYDPEYMEVGNIHKGESLLNRKIRRLSLERLTTNLNFYKRYNIIGPNAVWSGIPHREDLKRVFGVPDDNYKNQVIKEIQETK